MFRAIISIILGIFLIVVLGDVILQTFPELTPLWEEFKMIVVNLYESSKVKYGALATIAIIVGLMVVIGTSRRGI